MIQYICLDVPEMDMFAMERTIDLLLCVSAFMLARSVG